MNSALRGRSAIVATVLTAALSTQSALAGNGADPHTEAASAPVAAAAPAATGSVATSGREARRAGKVRYKGRFPTAAGSKVKLTARKGRNGKPRVITLIEYRSLPGHCEETGGPQLLGWGFAFRGGAVRVNRNRRFAVGTQASDGGWAKLNGRFSKNFKRVKGTFRVKSLFPAVPDAEPPVPEEFCTSIKRRYAATR